ncbi:nucleolar complex protein 14, partial [Linderina pennispora]
MGKSNGSSKQSALKRLRSSLSAAGLTGPKAHVSKKDKKRGVTKASGRNEDRKHKLKAIQSAMNPFELQVNRKKLSVLGLKRKDEQVNVAVARQKAVEKRKATIGSERKNRNKAGAFIDRRIGENDAKMDPEEKMLQRFTLERQKRSRNSSMFNLEDDDDVEGAITSLTHFGQSLDDMDTFDDMVGSDDEGTGAIDRDTVAGDHFGGFEQEGPARKKTKAEVMQEVIAKSKQFKHERQLAKEQDDEVRQELDDDFAAVRALLFDGDDDSKPMMKAADGEDNDMDQSYDAAVRELIFEQRARPQDRLKTEDELIREEKEKLERAERHRQRRMDGLPSDSEPESDDEDGLKKGYAAQSNRVPEADDLGDDFAAADSDDEGNAADIQLGAGLGAEESEDEDEDDR